MIPIPMTGWIKTYRTIESWEWYKNGDTFRVWIHLLLHAAASDVKYKGVELHRGEVLITYKELANALNITEKQARQAIGHLIGTQEVTRMGRQNRPIYFLNKYIYYQSNPEKGQANGQINGQADGQADGQDIYNKKIRSKEEKEKEKEEPSAVAPSGGSAPKEDVAADIMRLTEVPAAYRDQFGDDVEAFKEYWFK